MALELPDLLADARCDRHGSLWEMLDMPTALTDGVATV
jgi:hypothetical protein